MGDFNQSVARTRQYEGGNVDNPADPGGATSRGITQRAYDAYCSRHGFARGDVMMASGATIDQVYREDYWDQFNGDDYADGTAFCIFDAAVNSGLAQATKWVQRSLGIMADGDFGNATRNAVKNCGDQDKLVRDICSRRLAMMQSLKTWKTFGKGWHSRVNDVCTISQTWNAIKAQPEPPVSREVIPTPKAPTTSLPTPINQSAPTAVVTVGGLGTVLAGYADSFTNAASQLSPLGATWPQIEKVCAALTVAAVVIGLYISLRHARHEAAVNGTATAKLGG